jgi:pimeloyl-ACP methyl ester carboxylesterase
MNHNMLTRTLCRILLILAQPAALIAFSTITLYSQPFVGDNQWNGDENGCSNLIADFNGHTQQYSFVATSTDGGNQKGENTTNNIRTGYQNLFIEGFRYGIFIPTDYNPQTRYHLIVYLHGYSDTTSWNFGWYSPTSQHEFPGIVLTPKCLVSYEDGWGNSWNKKESYAMNMTYRIIDSVRKCYSIDPEKIHICGTSMGGFGTLNALANHPDMFASAYAICGGGDPSTASLMINTPLWIFHGSNDQTVPVAQSRNMYQAILEAGGTRVRYTEYPGVGHNSWENAGKEATLDLWFLSQIKDSSHNAPDPVSSLQCGINGQNEPHIEWTAPGDALTGDKLIWGYRIYRNNELLETLNNDVFNYSDKSALEGNQYIYQVRPVNYFFIEPAASPGKSIRIPSPESNE